MTGRPHNSVPLSATGQVSHHLSPSHLLQLTLTSRQPEHRSCTTAAGTILTWLTDGVLRIDPPPYSAVARDLVLSAGIHGNETAPMELVDSLLKLIDSDRLVPRARLLVLLGNPAAIRTGQRYVDYDLNRLFNGAHQRVATPSAARAAELELLVRNFYDSARPSVNRRERLHYDLHTAIRGSLVEKFALYPENSDALQRLECARLHAAGITCVVLQKAPSATFSAFSANTCEAHSLTLELGQARPFGTNEGLDLSALKRMLMLLVAGKDVDPEHARPEAVRLFRASREIIKRSDDFRLHLSDDVDNFTPLPPGMLVAEDGEEQVLVTESEARILFPNPKVKNGLRAGIIIVPASPPHL